MNVRVSWNERGVAAVALHLSLEQKVLRASQAPKCGVARIAMLSMRRIGVAVDKSSSASIVRCHCHFTIYLSGFALLDQQTHKIVSSCSSMPTHATLPPAAALPQQAL